MTPLRERLADTFDAFKHPFVFGFIAGTTFAGLVLILLDTLGLK